MEPILISFPEEKNQQNHRFSAHCELGACLGSSDSILSRSQRRQMSTGLRSELATSRWQTHPLSHRGQEHFMSDSPSRIPLPIIQVIQVAIFMETGFSINAGTLLDGAKFMENPKYG
jgi:hypothetical protein